MSTRESSSTSMSACHGATDGEVNDFGAVRSVFFCDPDGLEGEVLVAK
jgi:hypothetical protein